MKNMNTLKGKIMTIVTITIIVFMVILDIIIYSTLVINLENNIKEDISKSKIIIEDTIKNYYMSNDISIEENVLEKEPWNIVYNIQRKLGGFIECINKDGNSVINIGKRLYEENDIDKENKSILLDIKYIDKGVIGNLNYPFYLEGENLGNIIFQKDYSDLKVINRKSITAISVISIFMIIMVLFIINRILKKIINPLTLLENGINKVAVGDYSGNIDVIYHDEIGNLTDKFNIMKEKILLQIEEVNREKEATEKLAKVRTEFFDNATHELKTPLTVIKGYSQILIGEVKDKDFEKRAISRIYLESERLHKLVVLLLDRSKERTNIIRKEEETNLRDFIEEIVEDSEFNNENIKINRNLQNVSRKIFRDDFAQVIINLIDNGIKYTNNKEVSIDLQLYRGNVVVEIRNETEEIPGNILDNLFEPFKSYNYGKENESSTGLGLYICKELTKELNWNLTYEYENQKIKFRLEIL